MGVPARSAARPRGQALAEFALIFPVFLLLFGVAIDLSRVYDTWLKLEAATRDAAEYAATNSTTQAQAETNARSLVCAEFGQGPTCTDPVVEPSLHERRNPVQLLGALPKDLAVVTHTDKPLRPDLEFHRRQAPFVNTDCLLDRLAAGQRAGLIQLRDYAGACLC